MNRILRSPTPVSIPAQFPTLIPVSISTWVSTLIQVAISTWVPTLISVAVALKKIDAAFAVHQPRK